MVNKQLGFLIILLILFSVSPCRAQEYSLSTDRPDQGDGVQIVPKYKFQIENGILFSEETVYNNFMLRYGLTKSTELRLQFDFGKEFENYGLQPVTFSLKQRILFKTD